MDEVDILDFLAQEGFLHPLAHFRRHLIADKVFRDLPLHHPQVGDCQVRRLKKLDDSRLAFARRTLRGVGCIPAAPHVQALFEPVVQRV